MRWNNGDIDLDADDLEHEDSFPDLQYAYPLPELPKEPDAVTVATWVKSPRMMLEALRNRLNDILEECEPPSSDIFVTHVFRLKPEYIGEWLPKILHLIRWAVDLHSDGHMVDLVNTIQPTPFKGEILAQLSKLSYHGNTPEFDRCINR